LEVHRVQIFIFTGHGGEVEEETAERAETNPNHTPEMVCLTALEGLCGSTEGHCVVKMEGLVRFATRAGVVAVSAGIISELCLYDGQSI
jgi:hypothetical protein